jgi:uncharacterized protein YggU (UPF0235/DUF167 family)
MANAQIIAVRLTPKASADRVGETRKLPNGDEQLVVYVTAPPDNGKANEAMIRLLAKHLDVAPSRLMIVRGQTNRNKLVRVE